MGRAGEGLLKNSIWGVEWIIYASDRPTPTPLPPSCPETTYPHSAYTMPNSLHRNDLRHVATGYLT